MTKKLSPRKVKICPGCPSNDLSLDITPQFNFVQGQEQTKKITVVGNSKKKLNTKIKSLF